VANQRGLSRAKVECSGNAATRWSPWFAVKIGSVIALPRPVESLVENKKITVDNGHLYPFKQSLSFI